MKDDQRAERWLKRAAEIRAEALAMPQTDTQASLLKLAADWEHMGKQARARAEGEGTASARQTTSTPGWTEIPNSRTDTPRRH
jgi:hypothetical protein